MNRTAVPADIASERPTDPQLKFIRGLVAERDMTKLNINQHNWLMRNLASPENEQFIGVSVKRASDIIKQLLKLPLTKNIIQKQNPDKPNIPAGRYAVDSDEGELRFYRVWISKSGYVKVYLQHGPDSTEMPYKTGLAILRKIEQYGIEEAAIRYGRELKHCSQCGRRLTNRISRELGIGPICGGRMFGDEFADRVSGARALIVSRGENPDEEVEDDAGS